MYPKAYFEIYETAADVRAEPCHLPMGEQVEVEAVPFWNRGWQLGPIGVASHHELKRGVFTTDYGKRSSLKFSHFCMSALSKVARWGIQMLREGPIGAARTNKDGGNALVWKQSLAKAVLDSLSLPVYGERIVHETTYEEIAQDYTNIVKYIGHQQRMHLSKSHYLRSRVGARVLLPRS